MDLHNTLIISVARQDLWGFFETTNLTESFANLIMHISNEILLCEPQNLCFAKLKYQTIIRETDPPITIAMTMTLDFRRL